MGSTPTFSIIVPVYNSMNYLSQCVDSIKKQTYSDFECVLVDDGSTDESSMFCDVICENDSRFRTIHIENRGVSHARNVGINSTLGQFVTFVDSDDTLLPTALESYLNILHNDESVDIVRGGV